MLYRALGLCSSCWKRHKDGPRKYWKGQDLLEEVEMLDGGPELIARRLGVTISAVAAAARRHGRPDIAAVYERAQHRLKKTDGIRGTGA